MRRDDKNVAKEITTVKGKDVEEGSDGGEWTQCKVNSKNTTLIQSSNRIEKHAIMIMDTEQGQDWQR